MQEEYKILGLEKGATRQQIDEAYNALRSKYRNDMFEEGEKGSKAAKALTDVENAYRDIIDELERTDNLSSSGNNYSAVEQLVKDGKINEAQKLLDDMMSRDGDWNYYQAMIYYRKDWFTDCKKQLELALEKDPTNTKFKGAYDRLKKVMDGGNQKAEKKETPKYSPYDEPDYNEEDDKKEQRKQSTYRNYNPNDNDRQMGGCDDTMDCCSQLICLNCLCNMCGGGCN